MCLCHLNLRIRFDLWITSVRSSILFLYPTRDQILLVHRSQGPVWLVDDSASDIKTYEPVSFVSDPYLCIQVKGRSGLWMTLRQT